MVIMTSNHPQRLDKALIRKGRVDLSLEFRKASSQIVHEMFTSFYDKHWPSDVGGPSADCRTPAEVSAILFDNFDTPRLAAVELTS